MYPYKGNIYLCPFSDSQLYNDTLNKSKFWLNENFYEVNLSSIYGQAYEHYISQPIVGSISPYCLLSQIMTKYEIDFTTVSLESLRSFEIPLEWHAQYTGLVHGVAGWFDVVFPSNNLEIVEQENILSTSPYVSGTHWHQIRFLLPKPIAMNQNQVLIGKMKWEANDQRSYDLSIELHLRGTDIYMKQNYRLNDQQYCYNYINNNPSPPLPSLQLFQERALNPLENDHSKFEAFSLY